MRLNHGSGAAGEDAALVFLQKQGCKLLARNWHCPYGEIDLIVKNGSMILFVEVKYRRHGSFGGAVYSITPSKLLKLQRSAEHYLQQNSLNHVPCRLDAVLIQGKEAPYWVQNITG
ncbi:MULTISPECIES: YraN family protein [unclassified Neisseria]|uniref:YraN family protein n=1 Tax=unclassified Neisseria TaxID=2623750 RepID=UPI002666FDC7|nr:MULTISPECIES: YraN family protein [unclassified Neisseria]MDO1510996.1 YraN family protein [Neisseria sp. MVDL19-042950]MDO1517255.1 YraN family protein [Neisseria sp. MVDL18-041461]MDO1564618.1 YraN family protein [Neisseria sp. MVDL20-010259]